MDSFEYKFPGTIDFCFCEPGSGERNYVKQTQGDSNSCQSGTILEKNYCKHVKIDEFGMKNWRLDNNNRICKDVGNKRISFSNSYLNMESNGDCKSGFKKCGKIKKEDELLSHVCIPDSFSKCPITDILIAEANPDATIFTEEIPLYGLSGGKKMYISRNNNLPLVQFVIDESGVCVNHEDRKITPGRSNSEFVMYKKVDCSHDERFRLVDSWNEYDLVKANTGRFELMELAGFAQKEFTYGQYVANVVGIKKSAISEIKNFFDLSEKIEKTNQAISIISILAIVLSIVLGILVFFTSI